MISTSAPDIEPIYYNLSASFAIVEFQLAYLKNRVQRFYSILSTTVTVKNLFKIHSSADNQRADW